VELLKVLLLGSLMSGSIRARRSLRASLKAVVPSQRTEERSYAGPTTHAFYVDLLLTRVSTSCGVQARVEKLERQI
jgi:hypothetical protein